MRLQHGGASMGFLKGRFLVQAGGTGLHRVLREQCWEASYYHNLNQKVVSASFGPGTGGVIIIIIIIIFFFYFHSGKIFSCVGERSVMTVKQTEPKSVLSSGLVNVDVMGGAALAAASRNLNTTLAPKGPNGVELFYLKII
jgi:hypothetical protein